MDKDTDIQHCPEVTDLAKNTVAISARVSFNNTTKLLALTMNILKSLVLVFFLFLPNSTKSCLKVSSTLS